MFVSRCLLAHQFMLRDVTTLNHLNLASCTLKRWGCMLEIFQEFRILVVVNYLGSYNYRFTCVLCQLVQFYFLCWSLPFQSLVQFDRIHLHFNIPANLLCSETQKTWGFKGVVKIPCFRQSSFLSTDFLPLCSSPRQTGSNLSLPGYRNRFISNPVHNCSNRLSQTIPNCNKGGKLQQNHSQVHDSAFLFGNLLSRIPRLQHNLKTLLDPFICYMTIF